MKIRYLVALLATTALAASACDKKDTKPAAAVASPDKAAVAEPAVKPAPTGADKAAAEPTVKGEEAAKAEPAVKPAPTVKAEEAAKVAADAAAPKGDDPMRRAIKLQRDALGILKANKDDPAAAAAALETFQKAHVDEIAALEKDLEGIQKKLEADPAAAMKMMSQYSEEITEITQLTMELASDAPKLLEDPAVAAALGKLSPNPKQRAGDAGDHGMDGSDHAVTDVAGGAAAALSEEDEQLLLVGLGHQEKMIEILEANADDPAKAGDALTKYAEDNAEALSKMGAVQKRLANNTDVAMAFAKKHMARVSAMAMKISTLVKEHPTLLTDEKIAKAMAKLGGN